MKLKNNYDKAERKMEKLQMELRLIAIKEIQRKSGQLSPEEKNTKEKAASSSRSN